MMIENFDDFCLWVYVTVDDIWQTIAPIFTRPGPAPKCSDSELLTMALVGDGRWKPTYCVVGANIVPCFPIFRRKVASTDGDASCRMRCS